MTLLCCRCKSTKGGSARGAGTDNANSLGFDIGHIFKFKPIEEDEFKEIEFAVEKDNFEPLVKEVEFNLDDFLKDIDGYNRNLVRELYAS